ncbi:MAG: HIT family protein [Pseudohongiellaceae bacterium]
MSEHDQCIFCRILDGSAPASFVYRDEVCSAFLDLMPVNPGHLLVIPNRHAAFLADMEPEVAAHLMQVGHRLAAAVRRSKLISEGINLFLADGEAAGQEVFHVHLHVIPRFRGDNFGLRFGHDRVMGSREELDSTGMIIRQAID